MHQHNDRERRRAGDPSARMTRVISATNAFELSTLFPPTGAAQKTRMAQITNVALCAALTSLVCAVIGLPVAFRAVPREVAWYLAPGIGWAIYGVVAFPVFSA